ncbi:nitroreductase family protein [Clostridium swellfunianum]|uniref:nitroreductase family protein n=1 Tax=Clostridium swellfunianum TaxID=1367462 RepID=UPI00202E81AC|nr:nitroreductase family protein [Clostridium swellfunianum]MCM0650514.1 nitroreductase family protein [Clostridium swellfunianum]
MELLEAIKSRRSIRKFKSEPIPESYIDKLIEAGRIAPSGSNLQPTRYVVIKSEEARAKLKECSPLPFVAQAPAVIAVCVDNGVVATAEVRTRELREANAFVDTPLNNSNAADSEAYNNRKKAMDEGALKAYLSLNAAIAIDHITLRAVDLGLGSCWVMMFDKSKVKELINLDERYDVVALLPVGYPDQAPAQRPRLSIDEVLLKEI